MFWDGVGYKEDVIICHSEQSEESTVFYRATKIIFSNAENNQQKKAELSLDLFNKLKINLELHRYTSQKVSSGLWKDSK